MSRHALRRLRSRALVTLAAAAALGPPCMSGAANRIWDGGAATQNWNSANNWNPNFIPSNADDVTIALDAANVGLSANAFANNLTLNNGAFLSTSGRALAVDFDTMLEKTSGSGVRLLVNDGALVYDYQTGALDVRGGAG